MSGGPYSVTRGTLSWRFTRSLCPCCGSKVPGSSEDDVVAEAECPMSENRIRCPSLTSRCVRARLIRRSCFYYTLAGFDGYVVTSNDHCATSRALSSWRSSSDLEQDPGLYLDIFSLFCIRLAAHTQDPPHLCSSAHFGVPRFPATASATLTHICCANLTHEVRFFQRDYSRSDPSDKYM